MITVKIVDAEHQADIRMKNEAFSLWGRMIPSYENEKWSYSIEKNAPDCISEMCFPDENYDFDEMQKDSVFIGAYDEDKCIGLAILQKYYFKYMYLYDLKVNKDYRGQRVAAKLLEKAREIAADRGYRGIYTQGQDNNLSACLFYVNTGFRIGGLDTEVYKGTSQEGKSDILFYMDI